jgi:hypothetical protein
LCVSLFHLLALRAQTQRYGKIPAFVVSLLVCAVSGVLTFFSLFIDHPVPFCLTLGVLGFGFAGTGMAVQIMISDAIDYDELHTGKRRESTYHVRLCRSLLNLCFTTNVFMRCCFCVYTVNHRRSTGNSFRRCSQCTTHGAIHARLQVRVMPALCLLARRVSLFAWL